MAPTTASLPDLLSKLEDSLETATQALPGPHSLPFQEQYGISLLDAKSELFLSYLQNLAFLILLKLRHGSTHQTSFDEIDHSDDAVRRDALKKLVELRIYLEKGIRPLELRLKYQIDKVVRASDIAERDKVQKPAKRSSPRRKKNDVAVTASARKADLSSAYEEDSGSDSSSAESTDDLSYRPNTAAFDNSSKSAAIVKTSDSSRGNRVYHPPRITPAAPPTATNPDNRARGAHKTLRSGAIDDYILNEVSTAPLAEPSIGSTIIDRGRTTKSAIEAKEESQRTAYEEANFVRLPPMSKKEKAKRRGKRESGFGGEELRVLADGLDRIGQATKKRPEGRATEDGPRGEGFSEFRRAGKKMRLDRG